MKTTFKLTGGGQLVISPMPFASTVHIMHLAGNGGPVSSFEVPADLAGVFANAVECAALAAVEGGHSEACKLSLTIGSASKFIVGHIPMRCHDSNACRAGQAPCPTREACGQHPAYGAAL